MQTILHYLRSALFVLAPLLAVIPAKAQLYTMNNTSGTATSVAANATATSISRVNGLGVASCGGGFSGNNYSSSSSYTANATQSAFEFSITANSGFAINATGLSFQSRRSGSGATNFVVAYRVNNTGNWTASGALSIATNTSGCNPTGGTTTYTIPGGVVTPNNGTLTFRIVGYGSTNSGGTAMIVNVAVAGSVISAGPTKLAITNATPTPLAANAPFNLTVHSQNASNVATNVAANTTLTLTKTVGSGTLSGTTTATLNANDNTYTFNNLTYSGSGSATFQVAASGLTSGTASYVFLDAEPTSQPTALQITNVAFDNQTLDFTGNGSTGYLVVRSTSSTLSATPADATTYAVGDSLGGGTVLSNDATTTGISSTGLTASTPYYYFVFAYNGSGTTLNYLTTSPLTGNQSSLASQPSSQPTVSASNITTTAAQLDFVGGDGANTLVVIRQGAPVSGAPVDAIGYNADPIFGAGDELNLGEYVLYAGPATGSVVVTNLSVNTPYEVSVFSYNGNGASADYLIVPGTASFTTNAPSTSFESDMVSTANFVYSSNIAYASYQSANITDLNSVEVAGFTVRDGGADLTDADALPTVLESVTFGISNHSLLRSLAIYQGSTELAEVAVTGNSITFTGLSISAADNDSANFTVRATFNGGVTDNAQFLLSVTAATANASNTLFAAGDAGGANSSTTGDRNRIEVTATDLVITAQPQASAQVGVALSSAFALEARDANGNLDLDFAGQVSISASPATITAQPVQVNATAGVVSFSGLVFNTAGLTSTITASATGLNPATTTAINVYEAQPTAQPTVMVFSTITPNSMDVSFSDASPVPTGYVVVRAVGTPNGVPADGTSYTIGDALGNGTVVSVGNAVSFPNTSLTAASQYGYAVYSYNGTAGLENYLTAAPLTGSAYTLSTEPTAAVSGLTATPISTTQINLTWTATPGANRYLVLRRTGTTYADSTGVIDGFDASTFTYPAGTTGTSTTTNSLAVTGLTAGATYSFLVIPYAVGASAVTSNYRITPTISRVTATTPSFFENFEAGAIKMSYASGAVTFASGNWLLNDALINPQSGDYQNGSRSVRLRTGNLDMQFNKTGGAGVVTFQQSNSNFSGDGGAQLSLFKSIDNGATWQQVGSSFAAASGGLAPASFVVNESCPVRFRISQSVSSKRVNIDDFSITDYAGPSPSPTVVNAANGTVTFSSAVLNGNVTSNGGAALTSRGFYYGLTPALGSIQAASGVVTGTYSATVTGLSSEVKYYFRAYATNCRGTDTANVLDSFITPIAPPVAIAAADTSDTSFTANWNAVTGAQTYVLEVASDAGFTQLVLGFDSINVFGLDTLVTGLSAATDYFYRVSAVGVNSISVPSNVITVRTFFDPATARFRSVASGPWNTPGLWQVNTVGTQYVATLDTPTIANAVEIAVGDTVTSTTSLLVSSLTIRANGVLDIADDLNVVDSLILDDFATLVIADSLTLEAIVVASAGEASLLLGSLQGDGNLLANGTTLRLNGSGDLGNLNAPNGVFSTLEVAGTVGTSFSIEDDITVTDSLLFSDAKIALNGTTLQLGTATRTLTVADNGNADAYVQIIGGAKVRVYNPSTALTVPIGYNPYLPVTITCATCTPTDFFDIGLTPGVFADPTTSTNDISQNAVNGTWQITTTANQPVDLSLGWEAIAENNVTDSAVLSIYNTAAVTGWDDEAPALKGAGPLFTASISNFTMNGDYFFAVGDRSNMVLPVEFVSFTAKAEGQDNLDARLQWATASEFNSAYFTIERSSNGNDWTAISQVEAAGNSTSYLTYSYTDLNSLAAGSVYYRLRQVDLDGAATYSRIVRVQGAVSSTITRMVAYPNPVEATLTVDVEMGETSVDGKNVVSLLDARGLTVRSQQVALAKGANRLSLNLSDLAAGHYTLVLTSATGTQHLAIVKF